MSIDPSGGGDVVTLSNAWRVGRRVVQPGEVAAIVRAAFGRRRILRSTERLRGGSKKGVYRLSFDDDLTAILYVWGPSENYWPAGLTQAREEDPFSAASGIDLFQVACTHLDRLGVRIPEVYLVDSNRSTYPADVALVEDVRGGTLETQLDRDPRGAERTMAMLGSALGLMHEQRSPDFGKLAMIARGGPRQDRTCEQVVLGRALADLRHAAERIDRVATVQDELAEVTRAQAAAVLPRQEYGLIHGELGPDHVLVDRQGHPVLIDLEGVMFFDVEWEHAFLELRFHERYGRLRAKDLDPQRLQLYRLAHHLSLVAGPLRLLDGDFPDRAAMLEIVDWNIDRAMDFLRPGPSLSNPGRAAPGY